MANAINNLFLVNAPAGSGKTTSIRAMVKDVMSKNPNDNILCITYTNRAAEELSKDFKDKNIFVGTIHSFLNNFVKRYFYHSDILALYFEEYGERIKERIQNPDCKEHIVKSNEKYIEEYGKLDYETVKSNIKTISYNESSYNSLYYGGLSHDDLISFSKLIFDRYPILQKRISNKYQYIFIDEYQDTMADVLKIFYESVACTKCKLYLFGDRMQQIYKNYDGSFEKEFERFDATWALDTNYRSSYKIVGILNKIYNDTSFVQKSASQDENAKAAHQPTIIICSDVDRTINDIVNEDPNTLVLYLLNKSRFAALGAPNLYDAFSHIERYSYERNYAAILTASYEDNPDPLLKLLYCLMTLSFYYQKKQYGLVIQEIKANSKKIFCKSFSNIKNHSDKQRLNDSLNQLFVNLDHEIPILQFIQISKDVGLVNETYIDEITNNDDYKSVLLVSLSEPKCVFDYLSDPKVSTQHGVKGESHDSVVFVADNSKGTPTVNMYRFFEMWSEIPVSIKTFNSFYYSYLNKLSNLQRSINMKINELNSTTFNVFKDTLLAEAEAILQKFTDDPYFNYLCKEQYTRFLLRPGVTNAKNCFKESTVYGVFSAYKLFYVGCSRARKKLTILIDSNKIQGDLAKQKDKFAELGFDVQEE